MVFLSSVSRRLADRASRGLVGALFASRLAERLLLLAAALSFARDDVRASALSSAGVALLAASRGLVRSPLLSRLRRSFAQQTGAALFRPGTAAAESSGASDALVRDLRVFDGLWAAELFVGSYLPGLAADGVAALVVVLVTAPRTEPRLLMMAGALFVVVGAVATGLRRLSAQAAEASYAAFLPYATLFEDSAEGVTELSANGREMAIRASLEKTAGTWAARGVRADWLSGFAGRVPFVVGFGGLLGVLVVERSGQGISPAKALAEAVVVASILPPFAGIAQSLVGLAHEEPRARELASLLDRVAPREGTHIAVLPAPIEATTIWFSYPGGGARTPALRPVSFTWASGSLLGVAGPNGTGKSTLLRLLAGVLSPTGGSLRVGDRDAAEIDRRELRARTAFVSQRPFFPREATVREAVSLFVATNDTAIEEELRALGLWARLAAEAPADPLSASVHALSVGERQRVALVRAALGAPALAFFDEPDASLDEAGVELLPGYLRRLSASGTMVAFVAHRPSVLAAADHVVTLRPNESGDGASGPCPAEETPA